MRITTMLSKIIKQSRRLTITSTWNSFNPKSYHRRFDVRIRQEYRDKKIREGFTKWRVGQTLRDRKHHIPKYKIERCNLDWFLMAKQKSVNFKWSSSRNNYFRTKRDAESLHPNHVDTMLVAHWWKI